jgi:hypothetical protein
MEIDNTTIGLIILGIITGMAIVFNVMDLALIGFGAIAGVVTGSKI